VLCCCRAALLQGRASASTGPLNPSPSHTNNHTSFNPARSDHLRDFDEDAALEDAGDGDLDDDDDADLVVLGGGVLNATCPISGKNVRFALHVVVVWGMLRGLMVERGKVEGQKVEGGAPQDPLPPAPPSNPHPQSTRPPRTPHPR